MKATLLTICLLYAATFAQAQTKQTKAELQKDSLIMADIISPAILTGDAPDWTAIGAKITSQYGTGFTDRMLSKGKIYYSYQNSDWTAFTAEIVNYTGKYEDPDDLKRLNKNAKFILQYSENKKELVTALNWSKHAVEKEPSNADYKETYALLNDKIARK